MPRVAAFVVTALLLASAPASAQQLTTLHAGGASTAAALPLDAVGGASFAFGFRKLRTGQTLAIKVTRQSDLTSTDIGFIGSNLDTATMLSFCAATNCTVAKFYDQSNSGNSADVTSTAGFTIVTAGALTTTVNGHAAALTPAIYNYYIHTPTYAYCTSTTCSWFGVAQIQSGPNTNCQNSSDMFGSNNGITGTYYMGVSSTASTACGGDGGQDATAAYTNGTNATFTLRYSTADTPKLKFYINGGTPGTNNTAGSPTINDAAAIGCVDNNAACKVPANSVFMEFIGYSTELSLANSNTLGANQAAYWGGGSGVSWSTISQ